MSNLWLQNNRQNKFAAVHISIAFIVIALALLFQWMDSRSRDTEVPDLYSQPQPIRVTQKTLQDAGYYDGNIDGLPGPLTIMAWRQWDKENVGLIEELWETSSPPPNSSRQQPPNADDCYIERELK